MGLAEESFEVADLTGLSPVNTLRPDLLEELVEQATIDRYPPGRQIFKQQEQDNRTVFLLSGQLALMANGQPAVTLKSDSNEACYPIAQNQPRLVTALARTSVTILSIDTDVMNNLVRRNNGEDIPSIEAEKPVDQPAGEDEAWKQLLALPVMEKMPAAHRQVMMRRIVEMSVKAGDVIIREGEECDQYYMIAQGRAQMTRGLAGEAQQQFVLGELNVGQGFDEGALIENDRNEYTVTMLEDGLLLKLSKGEFLTLMVRPFINWVQYDEAQQMQAQGAVLMDVRTPAAFQRANLNGSINMPLLVLRRAAIIIDNSKKYIMCCDVGRRSATAAFLLAQQGIDVCILEGGLRKVLRQS